MHLQSAHPANRPLSIGLAAAGLFGMVGLSIARPERMGNVLLPLWVRTVSDVPYGPYTENRLDLMQSRWRTRCCRPAVLVFHGGGWQTGKRRDMQYTVCRRYLQKGFLVANVEYRLGAISSAA